MGIAFLNDWFSITIRRNRLSYILATIALYATFAGMYAIWYIFAQTQSGRSIGFLVFGVLANICSYFLTAQRLRDINLSGWWALLWVPLNMMEGSLKSALFLAGVIILCAIPGNNGPNKFGPDPTAS